jgi:hypothetical protein
MNNLRMKSVCILAILVASSTATMCLNSALVGPHPSAISAASSIETGRAVLIINDPRKYAFFGWYHPTAFSLDIMDILNRTIMWACSYLEPDETDIVFFSESSDTYATFVKDWLISGGYLSERIINQTSANIEEFDESYYQNTDLVIYWNTFGYDPINVVNSHVPFITVSTMQTDEMGIGTGISTTSGTNDTFYIINNGYYPTEDRPLGQIVLDDSYSFQAANATSIGKVLISSEVESTTTEIGISTIQDCTIHENGSADISFTIIIPESPLAQVFRDSFFDNSSSLEQDVEYAIPQNRTLSERYNVEEAINDTTLLGDVVNGDGQVTMDDLNLIAECVGSSVGSDTWNPSLDLNWDGKIDVRDLAIAAHNYGKSEDNTGTLFVTGYYDGQPVNITELYYRGPEGSAKVNASESGYVWYHLLPGTYTVYGTFNDTEKSTGASVLPGEMTLAQLDFGGSPPPQEQKTEPVRESLYEGFSLEQLILFGFDVNIFDSRIIPLSATNETRITLTAHSPQIAQSPVADEWYVRVGPIDNETKSSAAEFIFTKIQYMLLMLQSIYGNQIYRSGLQIVFHLPGGSVLQNPTELDGLNWFIDFGGGTNISSHVTVLAGMVVLDELLIVSENEITANESYLETALSNYRMFSINYTLASPPPLLCREPANIENDWSKTWTYKIAPGGFEKTLSYGPLSVTLRATPTLDVKWYMGWEKKLTWSGYKLQWFESWMQITPAIRVEASAVISASYTYTKEYVLWTWSTRFTFWAGGVLVWANLKLTVSVGVEVNVYGQISISTWAEAHAWYKAGVRWDGGWSPIWQSGSGASYRSPSISASAGASVTPYAKCRLAFLLYDVGGPFVEAVAYAPIGIQISASQTGYSGTWTISLKLKINVGVTLAGWIKKILNLGEYSRTVADFTLMSWNGTWL